MSNTDTLINGNRFSWTSISVSFSDASGNNNLGDTSVGPFTEINYNVKQENTKVWGTGARPLGKIRGKNDATVDFSMYRGEWDDFVAALYASADPASNPNASLLDIDFTIQVQYSENGIDVDTDNIVGVRLLEFGFNNSLGNTDATLVKCTATAMYIDVNVDTNGGVPTSSPAVAPQNP